MPRPLGGFPRRRPLERTAGEACSVLLLLPHQHSSADRPAATVCGPCPALVCRLYPRAVCGLPVSTPTLPCTATPQMLSLQNCSISMGCPSLWPFRVKSRLLHLEPTAILPTTSLAPSPLASSASCCPPSTPEVVSCCTHCSLGGITSSSPFFTCRNCHSLVEIQEAFSSFPFGSVGVTFLYLPTGLWSHQYPGPNTSVTFITLGPAHSRN